MVTNLARCLMSVASKARFSLWRRVSVSFAAPSGKAECFSTSPNGSTSNGLRTWETIANSPLPLIQIKQADFLPPESNDFHPVCCFNTSYKIQEIVLFSLNRLRYLLFIHEGIFYLFNNLFSYGVKTSSFFDVYFNLSFFRLQVPLNSRTWFT